MKNNCICLACKKKFYVKPSHKKSGEGKFCSKKCMYESPLWKEAIAQKATGRKCSESTKEKLRQFFLGRDRGGYRKICKICGTEFKSHPSDKTVNCSKECSRKYFSQFCGPKSGTWKGGLTPYYRQIRRGLDYREWHKSVLLRDNFICRKCGIRGGKLHIDHIKPFALFPELRLEVSNGQTLCIPCHREKTKYDMILIKSK